MIARVIDKRYQILEEIGQGGAAQVFSARDTRLGRLVAIKALRETLSDDPTFRQRFENEAKATANLSHQNIVDVYDYHEVEGRYYITMEYVPGPNLKEYLSEHAPLSEEQTRKLIEPILRGLAATHKVGLVHRDMKPQNVLLGADNQPKIADFGIVKAMGDAGITQAGVAFGTPAYLALEQALGEQATPSTDVYAVGIMMYQMLSGRLPFEGDQPLEVVQAHLFDQPEPLSRIVPDVSEEMAAVVGRAMAREPQERYRDATQMLQELAASAQAEGGSAPVWALVAGSATVAMPLVRSTGTKATKVVPYKRVQPGVSEAQSRRRTLWAGLPLAALFLLGCLLLRPTLSSLLDFRALAGSATTPVATPAGSMQPTPTASVGPSITIRLEWEDVRGESAYTVERSVDGKRWERLADLKANSTSYLDRTARAGEDYRYRIKASRANGRPSYTSVQTGTPSEATSTPSRSATVAPPAAPTRLRATPISSSAISIGWRDTSGETGYILERSTGGGKWTRVVVLDTNVTAYTDEGLIGGRKYRYRVRARNLWGFSGYSYAQATTAKTPTGSVLRQTRRAPDVASPPARGGVVSTRRGEAAGPARMDNLPTEPTDTPTSESPNTSIRESTNTPRPELTDTPRPKPTNTPRPEPTDTPRPEPTNTPTPEPTNTPTPEPTDTTRRAPTNTPTPEPTNTPTPEPTNTPRPEPTNTPTPEPTNTPRPEPTNTPTPEPTDTPRPEPTDTPRPEPTNTPMLEPANTPLPIPIPDDGGQGTDEGGADSRGDADQGDPGGDSEGGDPGNSGDGATDTDAGSEADKGSGDAGGE
ncbi:MAG: protein kinase [Chloroflexota bacterium]|nr:protein kinase [Chloroflexota bacterium]